MAVFQSIVSWHKNSFTGFNLNTLRRRQNCRFIKETGTMSKIFKSSLVTVAVAATLISSNASASHFRGAAVVPTVSATGLVTVDATSFWRLSPGTSAGSFPHDGISSLSVTGGVGSVSANSISQNTSDSRRAAVSQDFSFQLPSAGLYTMSWSSGSWVSGVPNASGSYGTTSSIFWDGSTANSPIIFDIQNIQQEVVRGTTYSDNLDVIGTVTYDDTHVSTGMSSQAAGFSIDATGQITITNPQYADNLSNPGADQAYSGTIDAADGSSVEFVWLFDAVDTGTVTNQAPTVVDDVVNALVGDTISETIVMTDPDLDPVTGSFISFLDGSGSAVNPASYSFTPGTYAFEWDSTGFAAGTYQAVFEGSDGSLTDRGTLTINLTEPVAAVSAPSIFALGGLAGLFMFRSRRNKRKL